MVPACSSGGSSAAPPAGERLNVVAALFPLAEVARWVGGSRITLTDLDSGRGRTARTCGCGPDQLADHPGADVVIDVGGGFQPALEAGGGSRT